MQKFLYSCVKKLTNPVLQMMLLLYNTQGCGSLDPLLFFVDLDPDPAVFFNANPDPDADPDPEPALQNL